MSFSSLSMESSSFQCITCKLSIIGFSNFQRHVNSIEHANLVKMTTCNNVTDEEKVLTSTEKEEPTSTINQFSLSPFNSLGLDCKLCDKKFNGNEPYQQHLASASHRKKVGNLASPNISADSLRCKICDKDFSGVVPYEQHIVSKAHRKKAVLHEMESKSFPAFLAEHQVKEKRNEMYTVKSDDKDNFNVESTSLNESKVELSSPEVTISASYIASQLLLSCDICEKRFSGPVPYHQHLDSQFHKKKEMLKKCLSNSNRCEVDFALNQDKSKEMSSYALESSLLENVTMKSPPDTLNGGHPFRCGDCDKNFTGPIPFDQHIKSDLHLKKMLQKKQINGEVGNEFNYSTTPKSDIPNWERYYCKICDKQCTGAVPYKQHELSEAHNKKVQILKFSQVSNNLSKMDESIMDDEDDKMSTDDNCSTNIGNKSNLFSSSSELMFNDILKEVNLVTPDNLNITTFGVKDGIVF